jgi:serine/threonine-protein kinase
MATVHLGRLRGAAGFARLVAIKQLHPQYARDPEFVAMFTDEARLAARVRHPNVVPTLDVVRDGGELFLVMELIVGETLSRLLRPDGQPRERAPVRIAAAIVAGALHGLHAAHEARGERGEALGIVHRDISPQNILVGTDGVPRVVDFGVAKAAGRAQPTTQDGAVKGKLGYMAPEQLLGERVDRRSDVFAAGVVLWETLVGERAFQGEDGATAIARVLDGKIDPPSSRVPETAPFDAIVMRALDPRPAGRFATALEMARAIEGAARLATPGEVGLWVADRAEVALEERARRIAALESLDAGLVGSLASTRPESPSKLSDPPATTAPDPRRRRIIAAGAALLLAGVVFLVAGRVRSRATDGPASSADVVAVAPSSAPPTTTTAPPPESASAEPPPPPPAASSSPKGKTTRPPPPAAADCTPPYFTDGNGVRRYKKHCLR